MQFIIIIIIILFLQRTRTIFFLLCTVGGKNILTFLVVPYQWLTYPLHLSMNIKIQICRLKVCSTKVTISPFLWTQLWRPQDVKALLNQNWLRSWETWSSLTPQKGCSVFAELAVGSSGTEWSLILKQNWSVCSVCLHHVSENIKH